MTTIVRFVRSSVAAVAIAVTTLLLPTSAFAQPGHILAEDATRYLALGDSIPAGYKALPVTNAYPFLLYGNSVFDAVSHTLFSDAAIPGATSSDLLLHRHAAFPRGRCGLGHRKRRACRNVLLRSRNIPDYWHADPHTR